jgi:hypothetical protein
MESGEMTLIWAETIERFEKEAEPFLSRYLTDSDIDFLNVKELIEITNEDIGEFLSRDPEHGYYHPDKWAKEVFQNFLGNQVYYWDKLVRGRDA